MFVADDVFCRKATFDASQPKLIRSTDQSALLMADCKLRWPKQSQRDMLRKAMPRNRVRVERVSMSNTNRHLSIYP